MIWWLHEIDKFYNNLKKRVLRGKSATDGTMKKIFMGQKKLFQGSATNFIFSSKELFWLADHQKKKTPI